MAILPLHSSRHGPSGLILLKDALGLARRIDLALRQKRAGDPPDESPRNRMAIRPEADELKEKSEMLEPTDIVQEQSDH
jgi:hypothetical protein